MMQASSSKDEEDYKPNIEPVKTICRCCLTTERRVLNISLFVSHFLDLAGLNVSESDGLPPWLCYECSALLQKSLRFKRKLLKANTMLCDYSMRCAPFPIDAEDPELGKYSTPNLVETHTLNFDNMGKAKLGYQKILEHEKKPIVSALDDIAISNIEEVEKTESTVDLVKVEVELGAFSDYEDNVTLDEYRTTGTQPSDGVAPVTDNVETIVKAEAVDKAPKKKKRTRKKEDKEEKIKQKRKRLENNGIVYRISEELKQRIVTLWREGVAVANIAEDLGVTRNTVYLWTRRWKNEGTIKAHASNGRPRKTTAAQDEALINAARFQQLINTSRLAAPLQVSYSTIRRRLGENGIIQPTRKDALTDWEKAHRLEYAQYYLNYDFDSVAFTDEKMFVATDSGLSLHSTSSRYENNAVAIGFWGWMTASGPVELCDLGGQLNSQKYVELLRDVFLPSARIVYPDEHRIYFTQEFSATHNTRKVNGWIQSQADLELIRLPPKSPDLNPMESVWGLIVQGFDSTLPPTNHQLWQHVRDQWDKLRGTDYCASLVKSMRDRLQAVIDAGGGYTKFQ